MGSDMRQTQGTAVNSNVGKFATGLMLGIFLSSCRADQPSPIIDILGDRFPVEVLSDCQIVSSDLISKVSATIYMDMDHGMSSIKFAQPPVAAALKFSFRDLATFADESAASYASTVGIEQYRKLFEEDLPEAPRDQPSAIEVISRSNGEQFVVTGQLIKCQNADEEVRNFFFLNEIGGWQNGK